MAGDRGDLRRGRQRPAAAHDSGIVHRDFKPDNVLVGDDGRVRVADFGLAFAVQDAMSPGRAPGMPDRATGAPEAQDASAPDAGLGARPAQGSTAAGRFAGTPGYMAPAQLAGAAVDARADQFSFCVALYEALHGERPSADPPAGRPGSRHGEPEPSYPRWLGDLLARGLARDPATRFATMHALLAELTRSRERTRRRMLAAALIGALATAGVTSAALSRPERPPPCPPATDELTGVWDAATRRRGEAAILGTGAPFAASMWASTAAAFDRYAQRWIGAQQAACEATHVRAWLEVFTTPPAATGAARASRGVRPVLTRQVLSSLRFRACAPICLAPLGLARRRGEYFRSDSCRSTPPNGRLRVVTHLVGTRYGGRLTQDLANDRSPTGKGEEDMTNLVRGLARTDTSTCVESPEELLLPIPNDGFAHTVFVTILSFDPSADSAGLRPSRSRSATRRA